LGLNAWLCPADSGDVITNPRVLESGIVTVNVPVVAMPDRLVTVTDMVLLPAISRPVLMEIDTDKSGGWLPTNVTAVTTLLVVTVSDVLVAMDAVALTLPVAGTA
jgi:hypothetical protein